MTRGRIRQAAAALATAMALIYVGIGLGVLGIGGSAADQAFLIVFGAMAGGAYLVGAVLLARFDRRWLWVAGLIFQVFVYWAYFDVSKSRMPPFEAWGIALRVIQLPLLAALVYLVLSAPARKPR